MTLSVPCVLRGERFSRTQQRKQNHVANGVRIRKQHAHAIDADAHASCGRHAVRQRANVVFIHLMSFFVAALALFQLRLETTPLIFRIVEFTEAVEISICPAKISKRSVHSGSSGFCLDKGDTAVGNS